MKKEAIITLPHPHLRQKSRRIFVVDDAAKKLVDDMVSASLDWENSRSHEISAALAAVQIDRLERIIIIRNDFDHKTTQDFTALINPEIIKLEGAIVSDYEGCLSVGGGIYGRVPRANKIRVRALDISGNELRFKATGFLARVIQHEIDHTNGILYVDHIKQQSDAFFKLDTKGELKPLDYAAHVKDSRILWE